MHYLILTGMSGAGKTVAIRYLEDLGALCVDNLPPMMLVPFMEACQNARLHNPMIAIAADVRSGEFFRRQSGDQDDRRGPPGRAFTSIRSSSRPATRCWSTATRRRAGTIPSAARG